MKPPQPKLPKPQTAKQQKQEDRVKELVSGPNLEGLVLERFQLPEKVNEFNRFEELSKLYEIEQPFVGRTQVELAFDVYDGRRLQQGLFGSLDESEEAAGQQEETSDLVRETAHRAGNALGGSGSVASQQKRATASSLGWSSEAAAARRRSTFASAHLRGAPPKTGATSGLSWCKLLFMRRRDRLPAADLDGANNGASPFNCCLRPSDTHQDLGLMSMSTSGHSLGRSELKPAQSNPAMSSVQAALAPSPGDELDESELKREALAVVSTALLAATNQRSGEMTEPNLGPALALETAQMESTGGSVSVCLLDKRRFARDTIPALANAPVNGQRWARASARLIQLRRKLRNSSAQPPPKCTSLSEKNSKLIVKQLDRIARKASRKFWSSLARDSLAAPAARYSDCKAEPDVGQKEQKFDSDELIDLVKGSLNQLIDAQLLLRNKLTNLEQLNSSPIMNRVRSAEYENLLRNNFNLLKIWQNLEETSDGLVCFVSEPIKASLADLFWFNQRRADWPQARAFELANLNSNTTIANGSPGGSSPLLVSPLVCLDASQVKRGLLQILEALNFLHAICRLIHRNLTPKNILICHADNWKLSGLEFAVRFESTLISESASMMAHEFAQARFASAQSSLTYHLGAAPSPAAGANAPLRRQRTLHQTKCQEFEGRSRGSLLQPDLDYLAPEILRQSKCSHKSDLFSFGLVLGQTYDLCRHKSQMSCRSRAQLYETELKKLDERRKWKMAQFVPLEMRLVLVEMLDCEPNLRPSASYVLQLLKRPLELCKANEDSLRHIKGSLDYLEARFAGPLQTGGAHQELAGSGPCGARRRGAGNYFRRVTSAVQQAPKKRQTRTLQLLNYFVRALDASALAAAAAADPEAPVGGLSNSNQQQQRQAAGRRHSFGSTRLQFEQTLETLKQVLKSDGAPACEGPAHVGGAPHEPTAGARRPMPGGLPADSRTLLLIVALHRRLLEQVGQLRQELPPMCRLIAPSAGASSQPLDRSLTSVGHRTLADLEERLCLTISRQSIGRLAESLADPLLKLEEFLLVFELVNDLVGFVGQKCKQNYSLRGKQLLNELTPVTGCPSLSSSEEEEDEDEAFAAALLANGDDQDPDRLGSSAFADNQVGCNYSALGGSALALAMQQANAVGGQANRASQQSINFNQLQQRDRSVSRQHLYNLPTSINITAPSPMGSTRDVSRPQLAGTPDEPRPFSSIGAPMTRSNSPMKRHSHQDVLSSEQLVSRTSQMNLGPGAGSSRRSIASCLPDQAMGAGRAGRNCDSSDELFATMGAADAPHQQQDAEEPQQDEQSRSKLIDELLKTINDDSFNEFIDFNNKLIAATKSSGSTSSQPDQMDGASGTGQLAELVNANRPKSALGGGDGAARCSSAAAASGGSPRPPRTLNLAGQAGAASKSSGGGRNQRGSICVGPSNQQQQQQQQNSTFDNVIRRMSTNFVQNFSKMSAGTLGASAGDALGASVNESSAAQSAAALRREKSSTATYSNSLYVDNQVPARRHSDNTINVPRIQVALSSPSSSGSRTNLNQRASQSASKLATKWKLTAKTNQREASDKLSPNLGGALGYIRRHSSGNTQGGANEKADQNHSNGLGAQLLNASPFKTRSNSNLGIDFLMSNRSMKRRYSAASMLGHQTQRKAEDLIDAGMKSVQNMFS